MFLPFSHSVDPHRRDPSPRTSNHVFQDKPCMMNRASTGVLHFIGSDGLENEGDGFKKRRSGALHGVRGLRDRVRLTVYEMPNPTIAAGTVIAVHEERRQKIIVVLRNWYRPNWPTTPVARSWRTSSRNSDRSLRSGFRRRSSEPLQVDCQCRRRDILRVVPEFPSGTSTI